MRDPYTKEMELFEQSGPIYGESSAPVRWENTIADWLQQVGFVRGENERSVFYHPTRDLLLLLYVDDCYLDGHDRDIRWIDQLMDKKFKCKELEWLEEGSSIDFLGVDVSMNRGYVSMSMPRYVTKFLELMNHGGTPSRVPLSKPITHSEPLSPEQATRFRAGVGCLNWMAHTVRPDLSYAHSRLSQHLHNPTEAAWQGLMQACSYLQGTIQLGLRSPRWSLVPSSTDTTGWPEQHSWEFFCDSDHAGNDEVQNKRKSQWGGIALLNGAPVVYQSKAVGVCMAMPKMKSTHTDFSSAASEIYAAGNMTQEMLHMSYVADEMGLKFPETSMLQIDNKAAISFAGGETVSTKLRHIDVRQEWVHALRDRDIIHPVHVPSKENPADFFTKILTPQTFEYLRDRFMHPIP